MASASGRCARAVVTGADLREARPTGTRARNPTLEETTMDPICPSCGGPLRQISEDQWPEGGPVPDGTEEMYLCDRSNHRIIVAVPEISG